MATSACVAGTAEVNRLATKRSAANVVPPKWLIVHAAAPIPKDRSPRLDQRSAERFFRRLLRSQGAEPLRIITDKLTSYPAAMRNIFPMLLTLWSVHQQSSRRLTSVYPPKENGKCADSNPPGTRNGFSRSMTPCRIYFEWADT